MKTHPRIQIRKAVVESLIGKTLAKKNVFGSRSKPLFEQHLPAILVYTRDEDIIETNYDGDGYMNHKRELELSIEAIVSGSKDLDDQLDMFSLDIEKVLESIVIDGFLNSIIKLKSTESDVTVEGAKTFGAVRLNYNIIYYTKGNLR